MRTEIKDKLIEIICGVVIKGDISEIEPVSEEDLRELYALARLHEVEHLLCYYLMSCGDERFKKRFLRSVELTAKQTYEARNIAAAFSERKIDFIILKGYVIRELYPESWMRNGCDVDILVRENQLDLAHGALVELGFERQEGLSSHDVTYVSGSVHIELHYTLIEEHVMPRVAEVLSGVFEESKPTGEGLAMSEEMFYFYHIAHMAKHFENGGCGIRPLLDLWMLNKNVDYDEGKRRALLERGGLLRFDAEMRRLSDYWFSGGSCEGLDFLENYILTGGAYGDTGNSVTVKRAKQGGRLRYLFSRLFAPTSLLKRYYPVLEKHPYLMPVYQVKRWIDAMKRDGKKYRYELRTNMAKDKTAEKTHRMLQRLGLSE